MILSLTGFKVILYFTTYDSTVQGDFTGCLQLARISCKFNWHFTVEKLPLLLVVMDVNSTKSTCAHTWMDKIKPTYDTAISCCNTAKNGIFCFTYLNVHLGSYFHLNISFILKCNLISKQSSVQARLHILLGYFIEKWIQQVSLDLPAPCSFIT